MTHTPHAPQRHLLSGLATVAAAASITANTGCLMMQNTGSDKAFDMSSASCSNSVRCPPCFILLSMSTQVNLDIIACSTAKLTQSIAVSNQIQEYVFINTDSTRSLPIRSKATSVGAALTTYELAPDESVVAYCYTGGSNKLYFPSGSSHCPAGCDAVTPNNRAGAAFTTVKYPTATQMVSVGYLTNTALTGNVPWGTNAHTTLGYLTNTALTGNVPWGTNAHTSLGRLTANQVGGDVTWGGTNVGFTTNQHGYLTELAAADPATNAVTYVTITTGLTNGASLNTACTGSIKGICDGR